MKTFRFRRQESGFSLIELMIAMVVLMIGVLSIAILFMTAVVSNHRAKVDSTSVMLSQTLLDAIGAQPSSNTSTFTIQDCAGNNLTINPVGSTTGTGATLYTDSNTGKSLIDWSVANASVPAGYKAYYVACSSNTGSTSEAAFTYEIRWNITTLTSQTNMVTVGARLSTTGNAQQGTSNLRYFAIPATISAVVGSSN